MHVGLCPKASASEAYFLVSPEYFISRLIAEAPSPNTTKPVLYVPFPVPLGVGFEFSV